MPAYDITHSNQHYSDFTKNPDLNVTSLDISGQNIGDAEIGALVDALINESRSKQKRIGLTSLNVSHNQISNIGAEHLARLTTLTKLDISYNKIDADGVEVLAKTSMEKIGLTELDISGNFLTDGCFLALENNTTLTTLRMNCNKDYEHKLKLTTNGLRWFLEHNVSITTLTLKGFYDLEENKMPEDLEKELKYRGEEAARDEKSEGQEAEKPPQKEIKKKVAWKTKRLFLIATQYSKIPAVDWKTEQTMGRELIARTEELKTFIKTYGETARAAIKAELASQESPEAIQAILKILEMPAIPFDKSSRFDTFLFKRKAKERIEQTVIGETDKDIQQEVQQHLQTAYADMKTLDVSPTVLVK